MLLEQDGFPNVLELSPGLVFATESVTELFKLTYPNLLKNIVGYLNPVNFFHFVILSDWLPLLLRITFFFRIVEEEKNIYMFKHVTQFQQENYFYYKCKTENLESKRISAPPFWKDPPPTSYHIFEKKFMGNGSFANVWFVRSRNWFMIHESQTSNSNSAIYHNLFMLPLG